MKRGIIIIAAALIAAGLVVAVIRFGHQQRLRDGQFTIEQQRVAAVTAGAEILQGEVKIIDSRRHDDAENLFVVESVTTPGVIRGILISRDTGTSREYK